MPTAVLYLLNKANNCSARGIQKEVSNHSSAKIYQKSPIRISERRINGHQTILMLLPTLSHFPVTTKIQSLADYNRKLGV